MRHIVMIRFREDAGAEERRAFREAVESLGSVPEVRSMCAGDNIGKSPNAYDFAVVMDFDDREAFTRYLQSDTHQRYVQGPARAAVASIAAIQHTW